MKALSVAGTAAMFLVGGGILVHGIPVLHETFVAWGEGSARVPAVGPVLGALLPMLGNALAGVAAGGIAWGIVALIGRVRRARAASAG